MNELLHNVMVQAYLDSVCDQVRCREVHAEIREELLSHVADRVEALMGSDMAESEAVAQALKQMGDPDVVGLQLHQLHRPRLDWWLLGAMATLTLVGLWAMYAVSVSGSLYPLVVNMFQRQLLWSGIGLGVGGALLFCDYRWLRRLSWPLFGATLLATGIVTFARLETMNGRPLFLELSPLCFLPALAGIFAAWDWSTPRATGKALAVVIVPLLIYLRGGWYFLLFEYLLLAVVLLTASKPKRSQMLLLTAAGATLAGILAYKVLTTPYQLARLTGWLHALDDPQVTGYHLVQSLTSLKHAGFWGQGALSRLDTLPAVQTDFVFPYLVYTLGWIAGAALCLLVLLFSVRLVRASRGVQDRYGQFLVRSIATLFVFQFGWNLLMTMGILPLFSVPLPFISGGSQQALYMALVGLTLSVFRRKTTTAKI